MRGDALSDPLAKSLTIFEIVQLCMYKTIKEDELLTSGLSLRP